MTDRFARLLDLLPGLSNDELVEIEVDRHTFHDDAGYRRWVDAVLAEIDRRALVERHPADGAAMTFSPAPGGDQISGRLYPLRPARTNVRAAAN